MIVLNPEARPACEQALVDVRTLLAALRTEEAGHLVQGLPLVLRGDTSNAEFIRACHRVQRATIEMHEAHEAFLIAALARLG